MLLYRAIWSNDQMKLKCVFKCKYETSVRNKVSYILYFSTSTLFNLQLNFMWASDDQCQCYFRVINLFVLERHVIHCTEHMVELSLFQVNTLVIGTPNACGALITYSIHSNYLLVRRGLRSRIST